MTDSIFNPNFRINQNLQGLLQDLDRQRWLIDNRLMMPRHEVWLRREIQVKRASGTTRIEGAALDEQSVSELVGRRAGGRYTEDEQANVNALDAYEFVDYLSDQPDIPIDELAIRELNRKFMYGASEMLTPGVYRRGQNTVGRFTPPDQGEVPALMRTFALWLRGDDNLHPAIKAGLAHIHLVAIHPFWDGNGRTARGLSTLVLQRSLYGFRKLVSLESRLFEEKDAYFTALERTLGTRFGSDYDADSWLEFFLRVLKEEAVDLADMLTDWQRWMDDSRRNIQELGFPPRCHDGIAFALQTGRITRSDYMDITGVSPATATRDLAALVEGGLLLMEGKTRTRAYRINPSLFGEEDAPEEPAPAIED